MNGDEITVYVYYAQVGKPREIWLRNEKQLYFKFVSRSQSFKEINQIGSLREEKEGL